MPFAQGVMASVASRNAATARQQNALQAQQASRNAWKDRLTSVATSIQEARQRGVEPQDLAPMAEAALLDTQNRVQLGELDTIHLQQAGLVIKNALTAPTAEEQRQQEIELAGQTAEAEAAGRARGTPEKPSPQKTVFNSTTGKVEFATDAEIAQNESLVPFQKEETPSFQSKVAINPQTGKQIRARFNPQTGQTTTETGEPLPEGFITASAQVAGTPEELTAGGRKALEQDVIDAEDALATLERTRSRFKPEFLQAIPRAKVALANFAERMGAKLTDEQKKEIEEYTKFARGAIETVNTTIKQITGAQMSEKEADRIRRQVPDIDEDGPTEFKANMDDSIESLKLAIARKKWMLRNGIDHDFSSEEEPPVSIEQFREMINARGAELKAQGMDQIEVVSTLKEEFQI